MIYPTRWVEDGSLVEDWTNWGEGAPSDSENKNCMYMDGSDGLWGDALCVTLNTAVCSIRIASNNTLA